MSEKIRDGFAGGFYPTGKSRENFQPTDDGRLGVTGKFNLLVDEVGQITNLQTQTKTTVVDAINEVNNGTIGSVKLNSTHQTLVGSYTFGTIPNTSDDVTFNHDVVFEGNVRFAGGVGNTLELDNNYISLGDSTSVSPVGDGGLILERGNNIENAQVLWDESDLKWKLKSASSTFSPIIHEDVVNSNALSYIKTGDLNAPDFEVISNNPFVRLNRSNAGVNDKTWSVNNSTTNGNLIVQAVGDNGTSTTKAYEVNRSGITITGHQFYTNNTERLKIDDTNVTSNIPIKVDSIIESTVNNGVTIDQLKIKDTSIVNGSNTMTNFTNVGTIINPNSIDLDFNVNGNGSQALSVNAGASQIYSRYNTYFDQGIFVDNITQRNTSGIIFNSIANFPSNIDVTNSQPTIRLNESDRGTDEKEWNIRSSGGQLQLNAVNDARSSARPAYTINRSNTTNSPSNHDMYVGDNVAFRLNSTGITLGESATDANKQLNLNVKDGFNYSIFFRQNNSVKAGLEYNDSNNRFNINRYADVGGNYIGGILVGETDVTVSGLDLIVNNSLNVNTINPRTGTTTTTLSNNVNITGTFATNGGRLVFGTIASQGDRIEFNDATNEFTFLEDGIVNNSVVSTGAFKLSRTTAPINTKTTTSSINTNGEYVLASVSDDGTTTSSIFKNTKNGINTTGQQFYINNNIELSLNSDSLTLGSGSVDNNISHVVNSKAGFNSGYNIKQGGALKGSVQFTNSSNKLDINRYANVGGAYVGGLSISETNILVDNLSLDVETTIKVDNINEFTNNNGITIDGVKIKDNDITADKLTVNDIDLSGNYTISSGENINIVLDSNNNQSNRVFSIFNHSVSIPNTLFTVNDTGGLAVYNQTSDALQMIDTASDSTTANTFLSFNYNTSVGSTINRMGYIGYGSTFNQHLSVINDNVLGDIIVSTKNNIDLHIDEDNNGNGSFNIFNGTDSNIFSVNENGQLKLFNTNTDALQITHIAPNGNEAIPHQTFYRAATVGGVSTNMGTVGFVGTTDENMVISNNTSSGLLSLFSRTNIDLHIDEDNNGNGSFNIFNGTNSNIFSVNENGVVSNISAVNVSSSLNSPTVNTTTVNTTTLDVNDILSSKGQAITTWGVFDCIASTPTILSHNNVSLIERISEGIFKITFSSPMPNINYCIQATCVLAQAFCDIIESNLGYVVIGVSRNESEYVFRRNPSKLHLTINHIQ